jgi:hypothetical protein
MAHEFIAKKGLISQGNAQVSGTLTVTNGITASLFGTASYAITSVTASYVTSSNIVGIVSSASYTLTSSYIKNAESSSWSTIQLPDVFDDTTNHRIGIGVNSPNALYQIPSRTLDVLGDFALSYYAGMLPFQILTHYFNVFNSGSSAVIQANKIGVNTVPNNTLDVAGNISCSAISCSTVISSNVIASNTDMMQLIIDNQANIGALDIYTNNSSSVGLADDFGAWQIGTPLEDTYFVANGGNFGINNTIPQHKLDVAGDINFTTELLQNGLPYTASLALEFSRSDAIDYTYPYWLNGTLTGSSKLSIYGQDAQYFRLNSDLTASDVPPALIVNQVDPTSWNLFRGWGSINNYSQVVHRNLSNGNVASTDFIAESDIATESSSYIDFGINSSGYFNPDQPLDLPFDGYLYNTNGNLLIGAGTAGNIIKFFIGDQKQDNVVATIEGDGIHASGSLIGSASYATTASSLNPGATFYQVSGSNGIPPAYIEPYDYCPTTSLYRPPYKEGRLMYDARYVDWTYYPHTNNPSNPWRLHLGKEVTIGVRNPTAVTMSRLSPVYISGSSVIGQYQPDVYLAKADGTHTKQNVVGVIRDAIGPGEYGFMLMYGVMHRTDMNGFNVGDQLWLGSAGGLTTVPPPYPYEEVFIGYCSEAGPQGSFVCTPRSNTINSVGLFRYHSTSNHH